MIRFYINYDTMYISHVMSTRGVTRSVLNTRRKTYEQSALCRNYSETGISDPRYEPATPVLADQITRVSPDTPL